jgi:hypothetical protein
MGVKRIRSIGIGGAGSASDVDGGAGSGGDMSDGGKNKKLKLSPPPASSLNATPEGSRSGTPAPLPGIVSDASTAVKGKVGPFSDIHSSTLNNYLKCLQGRLESLPPDPLANKPFQPRQKSMLPFPRLEFPARTYSKSSILGSVTPKRTIAGSSQ